MILSTTYKHGGQYHYRIHDKKIEELCKKKISPLKDFLINVRTKCPNNYFNEGPRSSILKISIGSDISHLQHHIQALARIGLDSGYYDNAHMNVQMFLLGYDNKTIAIETPIWLLPQEHKKFSELFNSELPLTGHIDLVRIEDGKIWIWDYKPNAHREKFADTQTYFYAYMLSKRTGIPLNNFMCGYFDDKNTYIFDPAQINL